VPLWQAPAIKSTILINPGQYPVQYLIILFVFGNQCLKYCEQMTEAFLALNNYIWQQLLLVATALPGILILNNYIWQQLLLVATALPGILIWLVDFNNGLDG